MLSNGHSNGMIYEINTWVWLHEWGLKLRHPVSLANLPETVWDEIAATGSTAVWLMGVWERSPAGLAITSANRGLLRELRKYSPKARAIDMVGSPYCVRDYSVDRTLGGEDGLAVARKALAKRGIGLWLDFVPNHVAPDHAWTIEHPEWLVGGSEADLKRDPAAFLEDNGHIFARGRDPYFPPWSDVLQLNAFNAGQRAAARTLLLGIAAQCDGVRCDMAMLMLNEVFTRTWGGRAGAVPKTEYWPETIEAVRSHYPEFQFVAEGYWDMEKVLLEQGFNACYDKRLYDKLAHGTAADVREHLARTSDLHRQLVRFLENHDEPRAADVFQGAKTRAAAMALLTLPGQHLIYDGQLEGRRIRSPVHLGYRPEEPEDAEAREFYQRLLAAVAGPVFRKGLWQNCRTQGWPDNQSHEQLLVWCWALDEERWVAVINYAPGRAAGRVQLPWADLDGRRWRLSDPITGDAYEHSGDELENAGLFVDLPGWGYHLLKVEAQRCL